MSLERSFILFDEATGSNLSMDKEVAIAQPDVSKEWLPEFTTKLSQGKNSGRVILSFDIVPGRNLILDFPREIREIIYKFVLQVTRDTVCIERPTPDPDRYIWDNITSLLRVNKCLYEEASPVLYRQAKFSVDESSRNTTVGTNGKYCLQQFSKLTPSMHCRNIRYFTLTSHRIFDLHGMDPRNRETFRRYFRTSERYRDPQNDFANNLNILAKHFTGLRRLAILNHEIYETRKDGNYWQDTSYQNGLNILLKFKSLKHVDIQANEWPEEAISPATRMELAKKGVQVNFRNRGYPIKEYCNPNFVWPPPPVPPIVYIFAWVDGSIVGMEEQLWTQQHTGPNDLGSSSTDTSWSIPIRTAPITTTGAN